MIPKVCLHHVVRVKDLEFEIPLIELVRIVREFPKVFHNDLPGIPPEREIDFSIDLSPEMNSTSTLFIGWLQLN